MQSFKRSFLIEVEKMYHKKKAVVVVVMSVGIIVAVQLLSTVVRSGFGILGNTGSVFPITVLSVFASTILPLFTALIVIDAFTGEFSQNTMKIAITKPVSRIKLYTSKLAATGLFVFANLMIVMILSIIVGAIFNSVPLTFPGLLKILISYLITLVPIMTLAVAIAFLANVFKSSAIVFFLSIVIFFAFQVLSFAFSSFSNLFITASMDWYKLWIADVLPVGKIFSQLLIMIGYLLIFFTAGFYSFDKRDL